MHTYVPDIQGYEMNSRNLLLQILMLDAGIVPDVDCDDHKPQEDVFGFTGWYDKPKTLDGYLASISPAEKKTSSKTFPESFGVRHVRGMGWILNL